MARHIDGAAAALGAEAAALLTLLETQPLCDNEQLAQALEAAKQSLALRFEATRDPRWLLARCFVVERCASRLIASCRDSPATSSTARLRHCVFLLENAVASSLRLLEQRHIDNSSSSTDDSATAMEIDDSSAPASPSHVVPSYRQLFTSILASLDGASDEHTRAVAAAVLSRIALLLAVARLQIDRRGALHRVTELLTAAAASCRHYRETANSAKWLLVFLGVLALVDKRDSNEALQHLRSAAECSQRTSSRARVSDADPADGVLHFWLGVALFQNGHVQDSVAALEACLRCNFAPIASLNLAARVHLSDANGHLSDMYAASLALQRALELDAFTSVSMVNYATLLGHMQRFEPKQQMLEYYQEARALGCAAPETRGSGGDVQRKRSRSGSPKSLVGNGSSSSSADPSTGGSDALLLITVAQAAAVLAPHASHVADAMVLTDLAYAALENGDWEQSKQSFEALLALDSGSNSASLECLHVQRDYIFVLLQSQLFTLALETCDRVIASFALDGSDTASSAWLLVFLYRADALLSLECVHECAQFLRDRVEPLVQRALEQQESPHNDDEVAACHVQLLNNLAVATVCLDDNGGVDAAIAMLRTGLQLYPSALSLTFNLVLLLWRQEQKDAACAIWFEARGWSHRTDTSDSSSSEWMALVVTAEDAAIAAASRSSPQVSEHVSSCDATDEGGVSQQQLLYLNALVLNHWGSIQSSRAIQSSVHYLEYLDALAPRTLSNRVT